MVIKLSNLKRPGAIYDSSKLAILGNRIAGSINERTKGKYMVVNNIKGLTMVLTVKVLNPETQKYSPAIRDEQNILAGRISTFLNENGISHDIRVM